MVLLLAEQWVQVMTSYALRMLQCCICGGMGVSITDLSLPLEKRVIHSSMHALMHAIICRVRGTAARPPPGDER